MARLHARGREGWPAAAAAALPAANRRRRGAGVDRLPKGAGNPVWSPDGKSIAFSSTTVPGRLQEARSRRRSQSTNPTCKVVSRAVYRANGNPDLRRRRPSRAHLGRRRAWRTAERPDPTSGHGGEFDERGVEWAPDGSALYFTSDRRPESVLSTERCGSLPRSGVRRRDHAGREHRRPDRIDLDRAGRQADRVRRARSTAHPVRSYSQPDLWVVDAAPGSTPRNLTASYDFDVSGGIGGDQAAPRGDSAEADRLVEATDRR